MSTHIQEHNHHFLSAFREGQDRVTEHSVLILDDDPLDDDSVNGVRIHPWSRTFSNGEPDNSVYVSTGFFRGANGQVFVSEDGEEFYQNIIVPREEFVNALLAVFPELKRADDSA